jgi:Glycosyl hydrolases family 16
MVRSFLMLLLLGIFLPLQMEEKKESSRSPAAEDETKYGWKITFEDEFEDRDRAIARGTPANCFDMKPQCLIQYWTQKECRSEYHAQLKNLNKCNWRVYDLYNWMDFDAPEGEGINALNPSQVEVKDGNLYLYASRSSTPSSQLDCKRKFYDPEAGWDNFSKKCPIISGGINSKTHENQGQKVGFAQEYGRFEVRAILPGGPGTWPAHWLLPDIEPDKNSSGQGCGWPFSGEIDIMEMWADQEGKKYKGGLITGDCDQNIAGNKGGYGKSSTITTNYHTYSAEWTPNYVKFIFDDEVIETVYKDDLIRSKYHQSDGTNYSADELEDRFKHPARIPNHPFFWILNTTIERAAGKKKKYQPDIGNFKTTNHIIDYVRTYKRCTAQDDPKKCIKFRDKDTVYNYNTNKGETASVEINAFPSPQLSGRDMTARITSHQYCGKVQFSIVALTGQIVGVDVVQGAGEGAKRGHLYEGVLGENETKEVVFRTDNLAAGMYLVTAWFEKCGPSGAGEGNHVFKVIVI